MMNRIIFFPAILFSFLSYGQAVRSKQQLVKDTIKKDADYDRMIENLETLNQRKNFFITEDSIIGIGIITIADTTNTYNKRIILYNKAGDSLLIIERKKDDVLTTYNNKTYNRNDSINPLHPRIFINNPDYFKLVFDCIKKNKNYYSVLINKATGLTGLIKKKDIYFKFESVSAFIENSTDMGLDFDRLANPPRKSPNDQAQIIPYQFTDKYRIWSAKKIHMKGEWMKVQITKTESGWIRWKRGNQILIRLYYSC